MVVVHVLITVAMHGANGGTDSGNDDDDSRSLWS